MEQPRAIGKTARRLAEFKKNVLHFVSEWRKHCKKKSRCPAHYGNQRSHTAGWTSITVCDLLKVQTHTVNRNPSLRTVQQLLSTVKHMQCFQSFI